MKLCHILANKELFRRYFEPSHSEWDMHVVTRSRVVVMNVFIEGEVRREKAREEVMSVYVPFWVFLVGMLCSK